jgi:hypothetical protein
MHPTIFVCAKTYLKMISTGLAFIMEYSKDGPILCTSCKYNKQCMWPV